MDCRIDENTHNNLICLAYKYKPGQGESMAGLVSRVNDKIYLPQGMQGHTPDPGAEPLLH